uniref:Uncharacterized protein n=1 Tax=Aegilops tauschii subsp. strangulata TaxID=200361 RepID=A0A452YV76_AEGTS
HLRSQEVQTLVQPASADTSRRAASREQGLRPTAGGMSGAAYRDRGFGGAAEMDRKRIKEALEKHTERPSPSTSRGASREKELLAAGKITTQIGKVPKVSDV